MFQLTKEESAALLLQSAIAKKGRGGRQTPPYAFTELGVAMLSSVLNSERAVQINILIMRAFVRLRTLLAANNELARHLDEIEARVTRELSNHDQKLATHEQAITGIFKTLRDLMNPPQIRAIGFTADLSENPRRRSVIPSRQISDRRLARLVYRNSRQAWRLRGKQEFGRSNFIAQSYAGGGRHRAPLPYA
jgi:hypothetical protein